MPRRYLITGGAGFIGSNYAARLIAQGHEVIIYDNLSRAGAVRNLEWLRTTYGENAYRLIVADVRDAAQLNEAVRGVDVIVHLAAQVAVTTSVTDPRTDFEINAWAPSMSSRRRASQGETPS